MSSKVVKRFYNWTFLIVIVAIIIVVNIIGVFVNKRFDATQDKRYSLHQSTKDYLSDVSNFEDRVLFKIYLGGDLPQEVVRLRTAVEDKLKEFKRYAGKRVEYIIYDPNEGTEEEQNELFQDLYNKGKGLI